MTGQEFKAGWAMLTAALGFEVAESQEAFYSSQLRGLEDGAFLRGVQDLVASEGFAEFARFRRVPTLQSGLTETNSTQPTSTSSRRTRVSRGGIGSFYTQQIRGDNSFKASTTLHPKQCTQRLSLIHI